MNVLFLTQRTPYPPNRGDRIRSYHLLRFLSRRADVDLACLSEEPPTHDTRDTLSALCRRVAVEPLGGMQRKLQSFASLARGKSATEGHYYSSRLAATVRDWAADTQYDRVVAFCSSMYPYSRLPGLAELPLVVDLVDVDSQKWRDYAGKSPWPKRWLYGLEASRVERLERRVADEAQAISVVTEEEKKLFLSRVGESSIHAVPNGVDLGYFQPTPPTADDNSPSCVFVGVLDYLPNVEGVVWFCREVWPKVRRQWPGAKFNIVGRRPSTAVRKLAEGPGVEVHADVPDVRPYVTEAQVVVAPLRIARGIQNKVLEAMAMAKPVLATPQAMTGVEVTGDAAYCVASADEWAMRLDQLFADKQLRDNLGAAAREQIAKRHDWETTFGDSQELFLPDPGEQKDSPVELSEAV